MSDDRIEELINKHWTRGMNTKELRACLREALEGPPITGNAAYDMHIRAVAEEAAQATPYYEPSGEWRTIDSERPDEGEQVLVATRFDHPSDWRIKIGEYLPNHPDTGKTGWKVYGASWEPTHWMPLLSALSASFQSRVHPWLMECFGAMIAGDKDERNHRFLEEALELVQACGTTADEAHQLVDYVFGRPVGERHQEVGGVMVTLAALCLAQEIDMHQAGENELARVWTKVEQIREKQKSKPAFGPLPGVYPDRQQSLCHHAFTSRPINDLPAAPGEAVCVKCGYKPTATDGSLS